MTVPFEESPANSFPFSMNLALLLRFHLYHISTFWQEKNMKYSIAFKPLRGLVIKRLIIAKLADISRAIKIAN